MIITIHSLVMIISYSFHRQIYQVATFMSRQVHPTVPCTVPQLVASRKMPMNARPCKWCLRSKHRANRKGRCMALMKGNLGQVGYNQRTRRGPEFYTPETCDARDLTIPLRFYRNLLPFGKQLQVLKPSASSPRP